MSIRSNPDMECTKCGMTFGLCLCEFVSPVTLATRISVIMPLAEWLKTSNSGRLAELVMTNSKIHLTGVPDDRFSPGSVIFDDYENLVLYPGGSELSKDFVSTLDKPVNLIVPDGTWRSAPKVVRRNPELYMLKKVSLPFIGHSEYKLRTGQTEGGLGTFEAIARAIGIIEGEDIQAKLEEIFQIKVQRILWSRGKLHKSKVAGGIPERAAYRRERGPITTDIIEEK